MKIKSIILSAVAGVTLGSALTSCSDMLSPNSERHSHEVAGDTLYSYWGILRSMQNVGERYIVLGECRGDLVDGTAYLSDSIKSILDFDQEKAIDGSNRYLRASDYYHIINSCNAYLAQADTTLLTGTNQPYMMKEYAQVEAIRAWTYLQLIQVYGEVPFYTEPLLTTDDINSFIDNPSHQKANADNLADLLEPFLTRALAIETQYGFPSYENYGYTRNVCHSTKAMIPLNIILGDLYLTKGDKESCAKACQYYYNYLGNTRGTGHIAAGGALPSGYNYVTLKDNRMDKPDYYRWQSGTAWTEVGKTEPNMESITAIPSSTNKLWGTVLRGVNELFGYTSVISVSTDASDSITSASIRLDARYDAKQLRASEGYFNLCNDQQFELLVGTSNQTVATMSLNVKDGFGDARQYWVMDVRQEYANGMTSTEKFVTKQNPGGSFTTVYPMIYRKSMVWLRFAEALNRAGYPSYAFAILKNGLCKNDAWYPKANSSDYAVKDSAYYVTYNSTILEETTDADGNTVTTPTQVQKVFPNIASNEDSPYRTKADVMAALLATGVAEEDIDTYIWTALSYENYPDENCNAMLYYLDAREVEKAPGFLNFDRTEFAGFSTGYECLYTTDLANIEGDSKIEQFSLSEDNSTMGVHSRGCGIVPPSHNRESVYDYVKLIQKAAAKDGLTLDKKDIYNGNYDAQIQNYVEDLIIDEMALELAFEGTRFFDLMRVAHRRGDASYLAERVSKRSGSKNATLYNKLMDTKNWYFPLPQY